MSASHTYCPGSGLIVNADSIQRAKCPYCGGYYLVRDGGKMRRHWLGRRRRLT